MELINRRQFQGDHSPDNEKFPNNSLMVHGTPAHVKCYSYHAGTSVIVSGGGTKYECNSAWSETKMKCTRSVKSRMHANMQLTINSFRPLFPDKIYSLTIPWLLVKWLTFPWQLSNSPTFPGFPDNLHTKICQESLNTVRNHQELSGYRQERSGHFQDRLIIANNYKTAFNTSSRALC